MSHFAFILQYIDHTPAQDTHASLCLRTPKPVKRKCKLAEKRKAARQRDTYNVNETVAESPTTPTDSHGPRRLESADSERSRGAADDTGSPGVPRRPVRPPTPRLMPNVERAP